MSFKNTKTEKLNGAGGQKQSRLTRNLISKRKARNVMVIFITEAKISVAG